MTGPRPSESGPRPPGPDVTGVSDVADRLSAALGAGLRAALFLDYDGTLREIEPDPAAATPTAELCGLLDLLAADGRLDVTVVSGRTARDLESFLGRYPFGLVAEHGASVRRPRSGTWEEVDPGTGDAWRGPIRDVMLRYQQSIPGSFVEEKRTGLVWHYRRADAPEADREAGRLAGELSAIAAAHGLAVRHGRKIVEVAPAAVSKGAAVLRVLGEGQNRYALVLVAGDDATDESMFRLDLPNMIAIHVGDRDTAAPRRVPHPPALRDVLRRAVAV